MRIGSWVLYAALLAVGFSLMIVGIVTIIARPDLDSRAGPPIEQTETCWSGTLGVQLPEYPDFYWVNYAGQTNSQVQICGVGLRVGDIQSFPDYSTLIGRLSEELAAWRDCALDGPPLCPKEYTELKTKR